MVQREQRDVRGHGALPSQPIACSACVVSVNAAASLAGSRGSAASGSRRACAATARMSPMSPRTGADPGLRSTRSWRRTRIARSSSAVPGVVDRGRWIASAISSAPAPASAAQGGAQALLAEELVVDRGLDHAVGVEDERVARAEQLDDVGDRGRLRQAEQRAGGRQLVHRAAGAQDQRGRVAGERAR